MKRLIIISTIVFSGCGGPLTCNDSDAKKQVLTVLDSHLKKALWYQEMKSGLGSRGISDIKTKEANKDLGHYACSAKYSFEYKGKVKDVEFTYDLNYLEDKKESEVLVDVNTIKSRYMTAAMAY